MPDFDPTQNPNAGSGGSSSSGSSSNPNVSHRGSASGITDFNRRELQLLIKKALSGLFIPNQFQGGFVDTLSLTGSGVHDIDAHGFIDWPDSGSYITTETASGLTLFKNVTIPGTLDVTGNSTIGGTLAVTSNVSGVNVTSGADPGHTHTSTSLPDVESLSTSLASSLVLMTGASGVLTGETPDWVRYPITPPPDVSAFTSKGAAMDIAIDSGEAIYFEKDENASDDWAIMVTTETAPYTVVMGITRNQLNKGSWGMGLAFYEEATGKFLIIYTYQSVIIIEKWTDYQTYVSTHIWVGWFPGFPTYFKVEDNSTNLIMSMSNDGLNWIEVYTQGRTTFFTTAPDRVGFAMQAKGLTHPDSIGATMIHWEVT